MRRFLQAVLVITTAAVLPIGVAGPAAAGDYHHLFNIDSGQCLRFVSSVPGARVFQAHCEDEMLQYWSIVYQSSKDAYQLKSTQSGACMKAHRIIDRETGLLGPWTPMTVTCSETLPNSQLWRIVAKGPSQWWIQYVSLTNKCLTTTDAEFPGELILATCAETAGQYFCVTDFTPGLAPGPRPDSQPPE